MSNVPARRIAAFLLLVAAGSTAVFGAARWARKQAEQTNAGVADANNRTYFKVRPPLPYSPKREFFLKRTVLQFGLSQYPPNGDGLLASITAHLASENFDFSTQTSYSSPYITRRLTEGCPLAMQITGEREFASLYDLCRELLARGEFVEERKLLGKFWEGLREEAMEDSQQQFPFYVQYIVETYTIPALLAFKEARVARSAALFAMAADRLLIKTKKIDYQRDAVWLRDTTLLLDALLDTTELTALNREVFAQAIDCIVKEMPSSGRSPWFSATVSAELQPLRNFMRALYLWEELRFRECESSLDEVLKVTAKGKLRERSLLLKAHCAEAQGVSPAEAVLAELRLGRYRQELEPLRY